MNENERFETLKSMTQDIKDLKRYLMVNMLSILQRDVTIDGY